MDTAQRNSPYPTLGARVAGVVKTVQVVESRRLHAVRRRAYARHGNPAAWRNLHGVPFSGCCSHYRTLSAVTRALIDRAVARDLAEHPQAWEHSRRHEVAEVVEERPEKPNLVLTQGIDRILNGTTFPTLASRYCAVGTGTGTPAASNTALGSEVKRSASYLVGSGNCGTTYPSSGVFTYRRTYDQTEETTSRNYTELGFSDASSGGLFSRLLISGGTVSLVAGQSLRTVYDLTFTLTGLTGSGNLSLGEWGSVACTWGVCAPEPGNVDTNGASNNGRGFFVPAQGNNIYARPVSGDFTIAYGSNISGHTYLSTSIYGAGWAAYTAGSGTRNYTWTAVWNAASFTSTAIRGFVYGDPGGFPYGYDNFAIKFGSAQTKTNLQKLKPNGITVTYTT
jgi:hypothetical protein